jgi:hypothetical protein
MFDIEVTDIQNIPIFPGPSWGRKKYNFPVSYRLIFIENDQTSYTVVGNNGNIIPYTKNYFLFLITSEEVITPEKVKINFLGRDHSLINLDFFMISYVVDLYYNQIYLEIYDLPTAGLYPTIKTDNIPIVNIAGFWKIDLENIDFSTYVEFLPRDLRFLFC